MTATWFDAYLACPDCQCDFERGSACECGFAVPDGAPNDFRPQRPKERAQSFALRSFGSGDLADIDLDPPSATYDGPAAIRDSRALFSAAEPWLRPGAQFLDLGCGPRDQYAPAAHYGMSYVGVDYASASADLLADGHALPFRTGTFDAVLAYAVLEHLYNPFIAVAEVARVLRPGGVFFGAVSQGEPFHDSYFHHTAFGVLAVFAAAKLRARRLWPSYDTLHALARMGRYPRAQRLMIETVHQIGSRLPVLAPRRLLTWTKREKAVDALHRAASICYVVTKD